MEGTYEIMLWDNPVGNVTVTREGLYYRFLCRCNLTEDTVCRVTAGKENLGVLVPAGEGFELKTKLPAKRFGDTVPEFCLVPDKPVLEGKFIPIKPEEPFAYIERLKNAYLAQKDGRVGIVLHDFL